MLLNDHVAAILRKIAIGDTLVVVRLDRLARSAATSSAVIEELAMRNALSALFSLSRKAEHAQSPEALKNEVVLG